MFIGLKYREGRSGIIGKSPIKWGPWKEADDLYFQWHKDRLVLIASPELEDFGFDEQGVYDDYTLFKEDSDGEGYFLELSLPIEFFKEIRLEKP